MSAVLPPLPSLTASVIRDTGANLASFQAERRVWPVRWASRSAMLVPRLIAADVTQDKRVAEAACAFHFGGRGESRCQYLTHFHALHAWDLHLKMLAEVDKGCSGVIPTPLVVEFANDIMGSGHPLQAKALPAFSGLVSAVWERADGHTYILKKDVDFGRLRDPVYVLAATAGLDLPSLAEELRGTPRGIPCHPAGHYAGLIATVGETQLRNAAAAVRAMCPSAADAPKGHFKLFLAETALKYMFDRRTAYAVVDFLIPCRRCDEKGKQRIAALNPYFALELHRHMMTLLADSRDGMVATGDVVAYAKKAWGVNLGGGASILTLFGTIWETADLWLGGRMTRIYQLRDGIAAADVQTVAGVKDKVGNIFPFNAGCNAAAKGAAGKDGAKGDSAQKEGGAPVLKKARTE
jgi:hypothetical protein